MKMSKFASHGHLRPKIRRNKENEEHLRKRSLKVTFVSKNYSRRTPLVQWNNALLTTSETLHSCVFFKKSSHTKPACGLSTTQYN